MKRLLFVVIMIMITVAADSGGGTEVRIPGVVHIGPITMATNLIMADAVYRFELQRTGSEEVALERTLWTIRVEAEWRVAWILGRMAKEHPEAFDAAARDYSLLAID